MLDASKSSLEVNAIVDAPSDMSLASSVGNRKDEQNFPIRI